MRNPLIIALENKSPEKIIKLLINKGAKVNPENQYYSSPLSIALVYGSDEKIINFLINKTKFIKKNHIIKALENNYSENIIDFLLNREKKQIYNKKGNFGISLMIALKKKYSEKLIIRFLNQISNFSEIKNEEENFFTLLSKNYSNESFIKILGIVINIIKVHVKQCNINYYLEKIFEIKDNDYFGWDLMRYLLWNQRNKNINYLGSFKSY